jgi:ubiquinone/menaquinone biosynthesis C-methylase UbiE
LNLKKRSFDFVFVCHFLEYLSQPDYALAILQDRIKTGGTRIVVEGDPGSAYSYPISEVAQKTIQYQVELQNEQVVMPI